MRRSLAVAAFEVGVLLNDSDADGDALEVVARAGLVTANGGVVELAADGGFGYTPPPIWWGHDTFEYTVIDGRGGEAVGTVRIAVGPTTIPLGAVAAGTGGFAIDGIAEADGSGTSVSGAGDVNGDGLADVIVGAPQDAPSSGRCFVVFGKTDTELVQLSDVVEGDGGFAVEGTAAGDWTGISVSGPGDVNGDGLADLLIGAAGADAGDLSSAGMAYVVFGKTDTDPVVLEDVAIGIGGFAMTGAAAENIAGRAVGAAGDVNGDGFADLAIGAFRASSGAGSTYVVFGKADTDPLLLADVADGVGGFVVQGDSIGDNSGRAVDGGGDVNGDGFDDLVIGAPYANVDGFRAGRAYVVFGKDDTDPVSLSAVAAGDGGFVMRGAASPDSSGNSVSGAGDVDGDGFDDLVIGAYQADVTKPYSFSGRTYIVFGKADTEEVLLANVADGLGGFPIDGAAQDESGQSVNDAGDVDGDGIVDIVIGSGSSSPTGVLSGQVWVVLAGAGLAATELSDIAEGQGGFALAGEPGDYAGSSVSSAGDVNGDGFADLVIGARRAAPNGYGSGRTYVVFGGDFTP